MQQVSDRTKLLIVLIGLACVAPGLSQRQRFRQDTTITNKGITVTDTQPSANEDKDTQLSNTHPTGDEVRITPANRPKARNNSRPTSRNKPKNKSGPISVNKPKQTMHKVGQQIRQTGANKPKQIQHSGGQRVRPTSANKPKATKTAVGHPTRPISSNKTNKGQRPKGQPCYTPENDIGQCFTLNNCAYIANVFNVYPQNVAVQYVRTAQRNCGNIVIRGDPVVCCGANQEFVAPTTASPFFPNPVGTTTTARNPFFPNNPSTTPPIIVAPTTRPPATTTTPSPPPSTTSGISDRAGDSCRGPDLMYGVCTQLANCPPLLTRLQNNPSDETFVRFLKISNEICANEYSVVCCPSGNQEQFRQLPIFPENRNDIPKKLPTMQDGCGYSDNAFRKIVGGTTSKVGAWPWIALIGYDDGVSASPFKCGGALISSRHVLTAAHCIRSDLTFVRLGEHDLSTDTEANHVDVPVSKVLRHAQYNRQDGHSDIAMLYLSRNVQFSAKITPICLAQTQELLTKSFISRTPFVAGWGRTMEGGKSATVLQELQIPVYDNSVCRDLYQKQKKLISQKQFDNAVICAGELGGGKDTCQGDSGGPLMSPEPFGTSVRFHLIGIVSYGIGCARPDTPGVYTRVANFIDWIQNAVADTP